MRGAPSEPFRRTKTVSGSSSTMNSRERALAACERRAADRTPTSLRFTSEALELMRRHLGLPASDDLLNDVLDELDVDVRWISVPFIGPEERSTPTLFGEGTDFWGVGQVKVETPKNVYYEFSHHPLAKAESVAEIDAYDWPSLDWWDYAAIPEIIERACAAVDLRNRFGVTPLWKASENGYTKVVRLLLEAGASVEAADREGRTPLFKASQNGHAEVVELLLIGKADVHATRTRDGATPILQASWKGHIEVVKLLLASKADVHSADKDNATPLYMAAQGGYTELAELLLAHGADVNAKLSSSGFTPLLAASQAGHAPLVKLLLDHGADVNAERKKFGYTSLWIAAQNGHAKVVKLLLAGGANVNVAVRNVDVHTNGSTPVYKAAQNGHVEVVRMLLDAGADVNAKTAAGVTLRSVASQNGHKEIVQLLLGNRTHAGNDASTPRNSSRLAATNAERDANIRAMQDLDVGADHFGPDENNDLPLARTTRVDLQIEVHSKTLSRYRAFSEPALRQTISIWLRAGGISVLSASQKAEMSPIERLFVPILQVRFSTKEDGGLAAFAIRIRQLELSRLQVNPERIHQMQTYVEHVHGYWNPGGKSVDLMTGFLSQTVDLYLSQRKTARLRWTPVPPETKPVATKQDLPGFDDQVSDLSQLDLLADVEEVRIAIAYTCPDAWTHLLPDRQRLAEAVGRRVQAMGIHTLDDRALGERFRTVGTFPHMLVIHVSVNRDPANRVFVADVCIRLVEVGSLLRDGAHPLVLSRTYCGVYGAVTDAKTLKSALPDAIDATLNSFSREVERTKRSQ